MDMMGLGFRENKGDCLLPDRLLACLPAC